MKLSWIFSLIVLLLLFGAAALWMAFSQTVGGIIWLMEGIVGLCLCLLAVFYFKVIKPMQTITNGVYLLQGKDFSSRLARVGQPEADRIVDMFNSMMHNLKEQRLSVREQNHFLDLLIKVSPMGIVIVDADNGKIATINPAASEFLDVAEEKAVGMTFDNIGSTLAHTLTSLAKDESAVVRTDDSMVYRCSRRAFLDKGYAHPFYLIEKLTDEVRVAERRGYEKVIRVIAHEVNNSMGSVGSMLDTLSMLNSSNADIKELIDVCTGRCHSLSKFITSYADVVKIPEANLREMSLNEAVESMRLLLESLCSPFGVELTIKYSDVSSGSEVPSNKYSDVPPRVKLDTVLFEQAMMNIVKNAVESVVQCRRPGEGRVSIEISSNPATIQVIDNGPGISDEASKKLFSPFFSTKPDGQGLGLILISDILRKHNCRFRLHTEPSDSLTRFTIQFPR